MGAAVSAHTVKRVEPRGDFRIKTETGTEVSGDEIDVESGAAHKDLRAGTAVGKDELPLLPQRGEIMRGEPVLMVEQHKMGVFARMLAEEIGDGGGAGLQAVQTLTQHGLMLMAEIIRAAGEGVAAGDVHTPEVVVRHGQLREDMAHLVFHITAETAGIAVLDDLDLRPRHAEQRHERGLTHEPVDEAGPHFTLDHLPRGALSVEAAGIEEGEREVFDVRFEAEERLAHDPRGDAGGAMVVKGLLQAARMKEADATVPERLRGRAQGAANLGVEGFVKAMRADAKHLKEVGKVPAGDEGHLQLQQRVLAEVHINGMDLRGIIEEVVERIAAGAGDHDDLAAGIEAEHLAIETGIFPSAVVDQVGAVDVLEGDVMRGFDERTGGVVNHFSRNLTS